jgi:hypothetical protein
MEFSKIIPFEAIEEIACVKSYGAYEMLSSVKKRTGADIVINGPAFHMDTYEIVQSFVCDGHQKGKDDGLRGFSFERNTAKLAWNCAGASNFISEYGLLVVNGEVNCSVTASAGSRRGRTAIGITDDNKFVVYVVTDDEKYAVKKTAKQLANKMLALGCVQAINLDGGGSSQVADNTGLYTSGRYVPGFICIWLKKTAQEDDTMTVMATAKQNTYDASGYIEARRYIDKGDVCTIKRTIDEKLLIEIEYPVSGGKRTAYIKSLENFKMV